MGRVAVAPPPAAAPTNVAPPAPPLPVMKGGAQEQVLDIVRKYARPLEFYFGVVLVLGIVYVGQIPEGIAYQANTFLGRLLLFWGTVFVADLYSWVYALLMALFTVLLISVAPRTQAEGFQMMMAVEADSKGSNTEVKLVQERQKWWVEKVLGETPVGIEEERVRTAAIQDGNNSSNSTTSSTGR